MFDQVFAPEDLLVVGTLLVLECILSIDNALVLGLLAKRVRPELQSRVLTWGLIGAFVIRFTAIMFVQLLMGWRVIKLIGGAYLAYVALKYFVQEWLGASDERIAGNEQGLPELVVGPDQTALSPERMDEELETRSVVPAPPRDEEGTIPVAAATPASSPATASRPAQSPAGQRYAGFWPTVLVVELTDLAFAVDSILAGVAMIGEMPKTGIHPKLWVVYLGGILGLMAMRVASLMFIGILNRFPRFEVSAYLLVFIIGCKLALEWYFNSPEHPHRLDFHSLTSPAFYVLWSLMLAAFLIGFIRPRNTDSHPAGS